MKMKILIMIMIMMRIKNYFSYNNYLMSLFKNFIIIYKDIILDKRGSIFKEFRYLKNIHIMSHNQLEIFDDEIPM